ncbi:MAG: gluconokinase, partial [Actinobacillus porcinus]|uniref:gluconokinase n=1 Tax=Actinobacillus porcinus TaxID=51048 RepID=UPI0023548EEA
DEDRAPWLERIRDAAFSMDKKSEIGIIVCSALKKKYRDLIRDGNENVKFIWLYGSYDLILERMRQRKGHYMKEEMLKSQFAALEEPDISEETDVIPISIDGSFDEVVARCVEALKPLV